MLYKLVELGIDKARIRYMVRNLKLTETELNALIQKTLNETLHITIADLEDWIKKKVPKRTGALRENLLLNLRMSSVKILMMRIIVKTSIEYAKFVNEMTTSQVAHSGETGYVRGVGSVILNDPEAIGHFFDELYLYTKQRCLTNLRKMRLLYLGGM